MALQEQLLNSFFNTWKQEGNEKQIDDVLVIGCHLDPQTWDLTSKELINAALPANS